MMRLGKKDWLVLLLLVACAWFYAVTQRYFIPDSIVIRSFALFSAALILLTFFFFYKGPGKPFALARTLGLYLTVIITLIILIQHFVLSLSPSFKNLVVITIGIAAPFVSAALYRFLRGIFR